VTGPTTSTKAGRPRRYDPVDELRILLDAALVVMQRNGYTDASVADILREADLSTRSFYRHFESKDQLVCALCRREAEQAAARLSAKVDEAGSPLSALGTWIDETLNLSHHKTKAARAALLGSTGAMRAEGYVVETRRAAALLMQPLEALIARGRDDGTFPLADPAADAPLIQSVVWGAAGLTPTNGGPGAIPLAQARQHVHSFCERALGVAAPVPSTAPAPR
jgi:AcrR family transcriptional regulator